MTETYLATSALAKEGFDGLRTVQEAKKSGFDGVQLFLDPKYRDEHYRKTLVSEIEDSKLGVLIHLPNEVSLEDKQAAEILLKELPKARVLIHYIPAINLPDIQNTLVGWENSMIGKFGPEQVGHIEEVKKKVREDNTFFVFDFGRTMYLDEEVGSENVTSFIKDEIKRLDPKRDIIHLADKGSWVLKFRDSMCVLGDGICADLLEDILSFDGVIVLEYEDLQTAVDSLSVIRGQDKKNEKNF